MVAGNKLTMSMKRSKYFFRTVIYAKRDAGIVLVDMHDASVTEALEPWLARVFVLADGTHTIQELIDFTGRQYGDNPPPSLEATIESVIERLHESKVIAFSDEPLSLPYYLSVPADEQDAELANRLMAEDGFRQADRKSD